MCKRDKTAVWGVWEVAGPLAQTAKLHGSMEGSWQDIKMRSA